MQARLCRVTAYLSRLVGRCMWPVLLREVHSGDTSSLRPELCRILDAIFREVHFLYEVG
jgi:hypothetical protein